MNINCSIIDLFFVKFLVTLMYHFELIHLQRAALVQKSVFANVNSQTAYLEATKSTV